MSNQYLGEIRIMPIGYAASGWASCNGQIIPISSNPALFSLIGVTYGGDGVTNFALPNLQGRAAMGYGDGSGLTPRAIGKVDGSSAIVLTPAQLAAHTHTMNGDSGLATSPTADGNIVAVPAAGPREPNALYNTDPASTPMATGSLSNEGNSQPHNNMQPYLTLNYMIALQGQTPPRS